MKRMAVAIVCGLALFVRPALARAGKPLKIGAVYLRAGLWKGAYRQGACRNDTRFARQVAGVPRDLGPQGAQVHTCLIGRDNPELEVYDVVVLLPEWTGMLPALDTHARAFHRFVERGGGLVVFQPNPPSVYPAGARPSVALRKAGVSAQFCTPKLLPLPATFHSGYVKGEEVVVAGDSHPLVAGLIGWQMPFPSDRTFDLHKAYDVLARGRSSGSASLAVAKFGDGRIVLLPDNLSGNQASRRRPPSAVVRRALLWAAGASDAEVRSVREAPGPIWPTDAAAGAIEAGKLRLEVLSADERIGTFQPVGLRMRLRNTTAEPLHVPANWPAMLTAEVAPPDRPTGKLLWAPAVGEADRRSLHTLAPGRDTGVLKTRHWFPCRPLEGRPAEWPYLTPGKYRFRLTLWTTPMLRTGWMPLEVTQPVRDERATALAKRRPKGRLLLVDALRRCPVPDGTIERPYSHLADALKLARGGDVVYCGLGRHATRPACVPDGVLLAGAGAANTVVVISAYGARSPGLRLEGACRVEDLALTNSDAISKGLLHAAGDDCRPTVLRCVMFPNRGAAAGISETLLADGGAAATFRNCILVSRVGSYAALLRGTAKPTFEYCTIVSQGFGVGIMDAASATLRRCIIAGQCPGILVRMPCEYAISESVLWCRGGGATFRYPITRWQTKTDRDTGRTRTIALPDQATMERKDIFCFDPRLNVGGAVGSFLTVPDSSDAAAYGAYAGPDANWPAARTKFPADVSLPDLQPYLGPRGAVRASSGGSRRPR
jgi:hypothetical protein